MKTFFNIDILNEKENTKVMLYGWAQTIRKMGNFTFVDLRDRTGIVQLIFNEKILFSKESVLKVEGILKKRKNPNKELNTGMWEVEVEEFEVLSKSIDIPFEINKDDVQAKEDTRLQYRYLDLRRPKMFNNLLLRHKIVKTIRDWFDKNDFLEIETPILSKSTPEGARDYLVPTRSGKFFALPQSPQLYKQLLMVSGVERYFQLSRAFRDEDMRKDRQPEFTQLDIELSFIEEESLFTLMEDLYKQIMNVINVKIKTPFLRMNYDDAIEQYGTDKPDLRYEYKLIELTNYLSKSSTPLFNGFDSIKGLIFDKQIGNKEIKILEEIALKNKTDKLIAIKINEGSFTSNSLNDAISSELTNIIKDFKIKNATIFITRGKYNEVTQSLGAVRVKLNELFELADQNEYKFAWIVNWPMFEIDDEGNLTPSHHPFTAPINETIKFLDFEPQKVRARSFDLVLNGFELSSGSIRIHDKDLQKKMFEVLNLSEKEIKEKFEFFINAFQYGVPPHGGMAFGIDRLVMILVKENSIRDVIAFPKNANGIDVMLNSPSEIDSKQLNELKIKKK